MADDAGLKRVFLSYGRADASALADKLAQDLRNHTIPQHERYEVWKDRSEIKSGIPWANQIVVALRDAAAIIAVLSPQAVRTQGADPAGSDSVCLDEIAYARFGVKKPIVPAMALACEPPFEIYRLDHVDFTNWQQKDGYARALERLLDGLKAALDGKPRLRSWNARLQPLDFDVFLDAKRRDFTGRTWLFDRIQKELDDPYSQSTMLVVGDPGIGKSAIVAELVHRNFDGRVLAYHCCQANVPVTLTAGRFVRSIAAMIASRHPTFESLIEQSPYQDALAESSCDRDPHSGLESGILAALKSAGPPPGPAGRRLLIVDALDEALKAEGAPIVELLASRLDRFPSWLRILATSRNEPDVLDPLAGLNPMFIKADEPDNVQDLKMYISARLASEPLVSRLAATRTDPADVLTTLAAAAEGNFLYAQQALDGVHDRKLSFAELRQVPSGLSNQYEWFFTRQFGRGARWTAVKPIFEVLVAAQEPIAEDEIAAATGLHRDNDLPPLLAAIASYVRATDDQPPAREIFHRSLTEWLTERTKTHRVLVAEGHRKLADGLWAAYQADRLKLSPYLLRHLAVHTASAAGKASPADRLVLQDRLATFVLDPLVQQQSASNPFGMNASIALAFATVASGPARESTATLLELARAWEVFRRERLDPGRLFELARQGLLTPADRGEAWECDVETELQLYAGDSQWTSAAKLVAAWLARDVSPDSADAMRRSVRSGIDLDERVDAEFEGRPSKVQPLTERPSEQDINDILKVAGGRGDQPTNPSMLWEVNQAPPGAAGDDEGTRYLAEFHSPFLVAFAEHNDPFGTERLRDYIALNSANAYRVYRNGSLWQILRAVSRHGDSAWVKTIAERLVSAALADTARDFTRGVDLTLLVLRAAADPTRRVVLNAEVERLRAQIASLGPDRGRGDAWGGLRRSLAAIAEATRFVLGENVAALLNAAVAIPNGYAGFQVPASLTLAETLTACGLPPIAGAEVARARTAAQNVQDLVFCARSLSRVTAFADNWQHAPLNEVQLSSVISRFVSTPLAPEFCAVHTVGEKFPERQVLRPTNSLPPWIVNAATLRAVANAFQCPLPELAGVNKEAGLDTVLPAGTRIRVPDVRWSTMLAAFLASRVMTAAAFKPEERAALIAALAIPAASNPTALDTVLSRLLIVLRPAADVELTRLEGVVQTYPSADGAAAAGTAIYGQHEH